VIRSKAFRLEQYDSFASSGARPPLSVRHALFGNLSSAAQLVLAILQAPLRSLVPNPEPWPVTGPPFHSVLPTLVGSVFLGQGHQRLETGASLANGIEDVEQIARRSSPTVETRHHGARRGLKASDFITLLGGVAAMPEEVGIE
jgi:hypothetical protein